MWNSTAVPGSRTSLWALAGTALLLVVVACGLPALWRRRRHPVIGTLAVLAGLAVLLPALGATGWGLSVGEWAVVHVPGAGLLRDSQKWVALAAPLYALAAAAGVRALSKRVSVPGAVPVAAIAAVVLALPDLVWGVAGALKPVQYPPAWRQVAQHLELSKEAGDVAVLPAACSAGSRTAAMRPSWTRRPGYCRGTCCRPGSSSSGRPQPSAARAPARPVSSSFCSRAPARSRSPRKTSGGCWSSAPPRAHSGCAAHPGPARADLRGRRTGPLPGPGGHPTGSPDGRGEALAAHLLWAALLAGGGLGVLQARRRRRRGFDAGDQPRHVPSRG
ncbi:hypothetical protein GS935_03230 [Rhodococcus hoagii]|nr:hypothetical protein [Prescottella equi]